MTCEWCGEEDATVRNRPRYGEEPLALCKDCAADLEEATRPVRNEP